ncbi:MAG: carboxymuconolactone decarboxylase family protein, partial [Rikenellaceae bacterium]|nr:carboxymuconolactone decarboxylase family protein [Rikenellaceae bacterium]
HTGGQLLIVTAGRGYYQEEGKPARELLPGDVVEIAPNVVHWHGAAPDSWFSHLAVTCNPQTNKSTWLGPVDDKQYAEATGTHLPDAAAHNLSAWNALLENDPELAGIFGNFAFGETQRYGELDTRTRILVTLASAIAQQASDTYRLTLRAAIANGITPVEIKEVLYHTVPYVGMAKVVDFIGVTNDFLTANGVELPLESHSTTTPETRYEKGFALQKEIFGGQIEQMYKDAPENQKHLQRYLSANCFGDYQTRTGLDVRTRELLTFSILVSLGGCESQVKGHIRGNLNVGNGKDTLLAVVTQLLPYIGYPRTLNAVACLNEAVPDNE